MKLATLIFFEHPSGKFKFHVNLTRKTALWHEDLRMFLINSRSNFLIIKSVSEKHRRENQNIFLDNYVSSENRDG